MAKHGDTAGLWVLERCANERFPYRLQVIRVQGPWLVLRVQDRWPAANRNIFCLRETEAPPDGEVVEEVERVPIVAFHRRGPRLSVVLDRKRYKRCDFLFLSKEYKNRPGETYEQIFWVTQQSMRQRRPLARPVLSRSVRELCIRIDSQERYPWRFPQAEVDRGPLRVGDYALMDGDRVVAVVERKTLDNLLADFGAMQVLHQQVAELTSHRYHALVVEAPYADFMNPRKVHHYSTAFCVRAIAELYALHPGLRVVFCANRKVANEWTRHYFAAIAGVGIEERQNAPPAEHIKGGQWQPGLTS
jgi:hypothetical protein